jgi:peptidoglycan/xylan/chitin deacetylase (PgdA/CDA1 family)
MSAGNDLTTKLTGLLARKLVRQPIRLAGHRPVVSITFDDFPKSAWTQGGPVLARYDVRGTYYTAGGFCGRTIDGTAFYDARDLTALASAGHEIGCHGFGRQPVPALTTEDLVADVARNREFLAPFLKGKAPASYAFPLGRVSPRTKRFYASRFASLRGTHCGVNVGRVDLAQLNVISLEERCWDQEAIEAAIQRVRHSNGWLILYTHDVSETRHTTVPRPACWIGRWGVSPPRVSKRSLCARRCRWR